MSIMDLDLKGDLEAMSEAFHKNKGRIRLPSAQPNGGLERLAGEFPVLMKWGEVCYACVVQADRTLYNKPTSRSVRVGTAEVVFNHKRPKTSISDPLIMRSFANYLLECKDKKPEDNPEWIREAASAAAGETDVSRVIIKTDDEFSMNLTMQSVIVFREHLPKKVLKSSIIPIIAAPKKCFSIMVLPCRYWSKRFIKYWNDL